ncbi:MAG: endonuclease [Melioribacteraceae bacterium]|nr:endonuclease [Melioribacteraceae bacterium]
MILTRFITNTILVLLFSSSIYFSQGYYDGTSGLTGQALKLKLHSIINNHHKLTYAQVWSSLEITDEDPLNTNNVILFYTGRSQDKDLKDQGSGEDTWNREHVWPKSHGFPNESDTAYTDIHHLRPADRSVNSSRGDKDFDNGGSPHVEAPDTYTDSDSWEPRDEIKGDVARMMFYMDVRYENSGSLDLELVDYTGTSSGTPNLGKYSTLLAWHFADPVDAAEQTRNEKVYNIQGNRNPFIDHPEFVTAIYQSSVTPEPFNHVEDFFALSQNNSSITLSWNENPGSQAADGYLIKSSNTSFASIQLPTDGVAISNDLNVDDGSGAVNLIAGNSSYTWSNLSSNTVYYFKIFPYTNSGASIDYKVDGTIPQAFDTTLSGGNIDLPNLFFSEYVEGGSNRKALEIYNPTEESISLANIQIAQSVNGRGWEYCHTFANGAVINSKDVYVLITDDDFSGYFDVGLADEILPYPSVVHFNGNDARALIYVDNENEYIIDVIGVPTEDPGSGWSVAGISSATQNHTLVRKLEITSGNTNWSSSAGTNSNDSEWLVYDQDEFSYLGNYGSSDNPTDLPPSVSNVTRNLTVPMEDEVLQISADATDDNGINSVQLNYRINGKASSSNMTKGSGNTYIGSIFASEYENGDKVSFYITVNDNATVTQSDTSNTFSLLVGMSTISDVKAMNTDGMPILNNFAVMVTGTASVSTGTFHPSRLETFIQDDSRGISVFNSNLNNEIVIDNSYKIAGIINNYNGLMQISPQTESDILDLGSVGQVEPSVVTIGEILADPEYYEGMLIRLNGVSLDASTPWQCSGSGANLTFTSNGEQITVRIDADTDICGAEEPTWPVDLLGVVGQFDPSSPYSEGYQVLPRSLDDFLTPTSVEGEEIPLTYGLEQNYPNPFNPSTTIKFSIPEQGLVTLKVYNLLGEEVITLINNQLEAAYHEVKFDASQLGSGVYFYRITSGDFVSTKKMLLIK